jgi:uncharacterized protein YndB with AHSA1/START domain
LDQTHSVIIDRPAEAVFRYVTDPANIPDWSWYIEDVRVEPPGPVREGSQIHQTVRGRESVWHVTAYEPFRRCVYETDYWYAVGVVTYLVEDLGDRARFTIRDLGRRKGAMRLLGPLLDLIDAHYRRVLLGIVKETLEADDDQPAARGVV